MDRIIKIIESLVPQPVKSLVPQPVKREYFLFLRYADYRATMRRGIVNTEVVSDQLQETFQELTCPLILISQVQRSGGTLVAQLFDGHSQILAHPHELKIGFPVKENWPPIDPSFSLKKQFKILFELSTIEMSKSGYIKGEKDLKAKAFLFLPQVQRELFKRSMARKGKVNERDVLDSYFTSYFNAWLNRRSILSESMFISGFVPQMIIDENNMHHFWAAYPDGYLVSIIRSPLSWYASAKRLGNGTKVGNLEQASHLWRCSTAAIRREKDKRGDRVIVIHFDDLVTNTNAVMRHICRRVGLPYEAVVSRPTFNGEPIGANTSFHAMELGKVSSAPVMRGQFLNEEERRHLVDTCMPVYERALVDLTENPVENTQSGVRTPSSAAV